MTLKKNLIAWCIACVLAGCGDSHPTDPAPDRQEECQVQLSVEGLVVDPVAGTVTAAAVATNLTAETQTLTVQNYCPGTEVRWSGVPLTNYDYDDTCLAGECADNTPEELEIAIGPHLAQQLHRVTVYRDGGSCNESLPADAGFPLGFTLPLTGTNPVLCGPIAVDASFNP